MLYQIILPSGALQTYITLFSYIIHAILLCRVSYSSRYKNIAKRPCCSCYAHCSLHTIVTVSCISFPNVSIYIKWLYTFPYKLLSLVMVAMEFGTVENRYTHTHMVACRGATPIIRHGAAFTQILPVMLKGMRADIETGPSKTKMRKRERVGRLKMHSQGRHCIYPPREPPPLYAPKKKKTMQEPVVYGTTSLERQKWFPKSLAWRPSRSRVKSPRKLPRRPLFISFIYALSMYYVVTICYWII